MLVIGSHSLRRAIAGRMPRVPKVTSSGMQKGNRDAPYQHAPSNFLLQINEGHFPPILYPLTNGISHLKSITDDKEGNKMLMSNHMVERDLHLTHRIVLSQSRS